MRQRAGIRIELESRRMAGRPDMWARRRSGFAIAAVPGFRLGPEVVAPAVTPFL